MPIDSRHDRRQSAASDPAVDANESDGQQGRAQMLAMRRRMQQRRDEVSSSDGRPLPAAIAQKFSGSLGADLGGVRVHSDGDSTAAAAAVGAQAFTIGKDIHFGAGKYDPSSAAGERLLAHEVAHTVQQANGSVRPQAKLEASGSGDAAENAADAAADSMVAGRPAPAAGTANGIAPGEWTPGADPKSAAMKVRPEVESRVDYGLKVHARLAAESDKLDQKMLTVDDAKKVELQAQKKEIDDKLKVVEAKLKECKADLAAIDDPSSTPETYNKILARQKSDDNTALKGEFEYSANDLKPKSGKKEESYTETTYKDGKAITNKETSGKLAGLQGIGKTGSSSREEVTADGSHHESEERTTKVDQTGFHDEKSQKTEDDKDGKKSSTEQKQSTEVGLGGASRANTNAVTNADGSSKSDTSKSALERKDGKLTASQENTSVVKNAAGDTDSSKVSARAGAGKKEDGSLTAGAGADASADKNTASGFKGGVVGGLDSNVSCNIVPDPADPTKFKVVTSIDLGVKVGGSAGYDKEAQPGDSKGTAGIGVNASGRVAFTVEHSLSAEEAKAYADALKAGSGSGKEFALITEGRKNGWQSAQKMYLAETEGVTNPDTLKNMKDGDAVQVDKTASAGANVNLGRKDGGGDSLGVDGGVDQTHQSSVRVEKVNGKLIYKPSEGDTTKISGGASISSGPVKAHMGLNHTSTSSSDYEFAIDPNDIQLQAELAECKSQKDFETFAKNHPDTINRQSTTKGTSDGGDGTIGIGPAEAGINMSHGFSDKDVKDKEGKTTEHVYTGTNAGGDSLKVGNMKVGESRTDTAVAHVGTDGSASFDAKSEDKSTNAAKWIGANAPGMGDKKDKGAIDKATGAKEPEDTDDHDVTGIGISKPDLGYLGSLACNDWGKWMAAGAANGSDIDDWAKAGREIKTAGGGAGPTAKALAKYVGRGNSKEAIVNAARDNGAGAGNKYEFPGGLSKYKDTYDAVVLAPCEAGLADLEKAEADKGVEKGNALLAQLQEMDNAIGSGSGFTQPAVQAEMLGAINSRTEKIKAQLRVLKGGSADVLSPAEKLDQYNAKLSDCFAFKGKETALFDAIQATYKDGDCGSDIYANNDRLIQIRDLYRTWEPEYDEMAKLAQENGFGKDKYWQYKPDRDRYNRALAGAPGPASEAKPEARDLRKKEPVAEPVHIVTDAEHAQTVQATHDTVKSGLSTAKQAAMAAGNRLYALLQKNHNAAALEKHNAGMENLRAGDKWAAQVKTEEDVTSFGAQAVGDYNCALDEFNEGLKLCGAAPNADPA